MCEDHDSAKGGEESCLRARLADCSTRRDCGARSLSRGGNDNDDDQLAVGGDAVPHGKLGFFERNLRTGVLLLVDVGRGVWVRDLVPAAGVAATRSHGGVDAATGSQARERCVPGIRRERDAGAFRSGVECAAACMDVGQYTRKSPITNSLSKLRR